MHESSGGKEHSEQLPGGLSRGSGKFLSRSRPTRLTLVSRYVVRFGFFLVCFMLYSGLLEPP